MVKDATLLPAPPWVEALQPGSAPGGPTTAFSMLRNRHIYAALIARLYLAGAGSPLCGAGAADGSYAKMPALRRCSPLHRPPLCLSGCDSASINSMSRASLLGPDLGLLPHPLARARVVRDSRALARYRPTRTSMWWSLAPSP